jgi:hypothetical protein
MTKRQEDARPVALTELTEEQLNWVSGGGPKGKERGVAGGSHGKDHG